MTEAVCKPSELVLPGNIHQLLDESLVPIDEALIAEHGGTTQLFTITGEPDLFVRLGESSLEDTEQAVEATHGLIEYGVNVLPAQVINHQGKAYVITKKVTGQPLRELLSPECDAELLVEIDGTWAGLAKYLAAHKRLAKQITGDVSSANQYVYGTIAGHRQQRLWLVDFPWYAFAPIDRTGEGSIDLAEEILAVANEVIHIQSLTGRRMTAAQSALKKAAYGLGEVAMDGDATSRAVEYILDHEVKLNFADPLYLSLRTK